MRNVRATLEDDLHELRLALAAIVVSVALLGIWLALVGAAGNGIWGVLVIGFLGFLEIMHMTMILARILVGSIFQ